MNRRSLLRWVGLALLSDLEQRRDELRTQTLISENLLENPNAIVVTKGPCVIKDNHFHGKQIVLGPEAHEIVIQGRVNRQCKSDTSMETNYLRLRTKTVDNRVDLEYSVPHAVRSLTVAVAPRLPSNRAGVCSVRHTDRNEGAA